MAYVTKRSYQPDFQLFLEAVFGQAVVAKVAATEMCQSHNTGF